MQNAEAGPSRLSRSPTPYSEFPYAFSDYGSDDDKENVQPDSDPDSESGSDRASSPSGSTYTRSTSPSFRLGSTIPSSPAHSQDGRIILVEDRWSGYDRGNRTPTTAQKVVAVLRALYYKDYARQLLTTTPEEHVSSFQTKMRKMKITQAEIPKPAPG
jgi:hypothetical protein